MTASLLAVIASQAAAAQRSLLERFRVSDATHPARARTLDALGIVRSPTFDEFLRQGAIREASPGTFYLDEATVAVVEHASRNPSRTMYVVLAILLAIPLVFFVVMHMVTR